MSGCWAQDLLREKIFKWKCNSMLWFSILLSSSFSQGPFSQCYNLPLQPLSSDSILTEEKLHLPCSRSQRCPLVVNVLLQVLVITVVLLGFSQHLLAVLLTQRCCSRPWELGRLPLPMGKDREEASGGSRLLLTLLPAGIRLGLGLCSHEHFFGSHTAYAILTSFHPLLLWHFCGTYIWVIPRAWPAES